MNRVVIFDVGNVLIGWDVHRLYRRYLPDDAAIAAFLEEVDFFAWNLEQDRGRPFAEGVADLIARHPHRAALIRAYDTDWMHSITGPVAGTVALRRRLIEAGVPLYGLTNFSAEKWAPTRERFEFLRTGFEDVVVSGVEGLVKPDPAIYRLLMARNGLDPEDCVFIDDSPVNVDGARAVGMQAIRFTDPGALERALREYGCL